MATRTWIGAAPAVVQVNTFTFAGTWEATDVINVAIGNVTVSIVAGSTVVNTIVATVQAALAALDTDIYPQFAEITWTNNSANLIATANEAGYPFTVTISTTETGGGAADSQTIDGGTSSTGVATTACSGPNFANVAANWSGNALPVDSDVIIFANSNVSVLYGLSNGAVSPTRILRYQSFTGNLGLPETNLNGYPEYRTKDVAYGNNADGVPVVVDLGLGEGDGPALERWNFADCPATVNIQNSGQQDGDVKPINIIGSALSVYANRGKIGLAQYPSQTAAGPISIGFVEAKETDVDMVVGEGYTITTVVQNGGKVELNSHVDTSLTTYSGSECSFNGTGALDQLNGYGGKVYYNSTGTLGGATVIGAPEVLDFSRDMRAKTVTNPIEASYAVENLETDMPVIDELKVVSNLRIDFNQTKFGKIGWNNRITRGDAA
jgi:hypothetical protein